MKSKYLFLAFAASAALVGCQNDEELTYNGADANSKAIDASGIRFAVSKDDAATRAIWDENDGKYTFNWTAKDKIGVAYIGDAGNEMASQGVTNYQFMVDSLYNKALVVQDGAKFITKFQPAWGNDGNPLTVLANMADGGGDYTAVNWQASYKVGGAAVVDANLVTLSNIAKFKTPNDYIFEGYYAVYYPFDGTYAKKGYIPVKSPESIVVKNDLTDNLEAAAAYTFSFSKPQPFKAGTNVAEFKLQQLSGMLKLNLRNKTAGSITTVEKMLVVPSQEFTVSGKLNNVEAAPSANVISDAKTASAIEVKFSSAAWNTSPAVAAVTLNQYNPVNGANEASVYIPMLPKNGFTGMDVYLINADGAAIKVAKTANFDITSAAVQPVGIDITSDKFDTYIAYDEASFEDVATNAPEGSVIELLKPVTLKKTIAVAEKVTIQGKSITLDENGALSFSTAGAVVKSDIIANGGTLTPTNATFGKLTINAKKELALEASGKFAEIVNNGTLTLGDGTAAASIDAEKVTNNGKLAIKNNASINPTASAIDNQGEVYQYVGSVIGATGLKNAETAIYTCEVDTQTKFDEAVERKATKIVLAKAVEFAIPATGAENITIQFDANATLKNESINQTSGVTTKVTGKVKAVISNDATSTYATIQQNLNVSENITVEEGKYLKVAKNYTVNVTGKIILKKNAKFEREQGGSTDIEAKVNCSGIETGEGAQWIGGQPNYNK